MIALIIVNIFGLTIALTAIVTLLYLIFSGKVFELVERRRDPRKEEFLLLEDNTEEIVFVNEKGDEFHFRKWKNDEK